MSQIAISQRIVAPVEATPAKVAQANPEKRQSVRDGVTGGRLSAEQSAHIEGQAKTRCTDAGSPIDVFRTQVRGMMDVVCTGHQVFRDAVKPTLVDRQAEKFMEQAEALNPFAMLWFPIVPVVYIGWGVGVAIAKAGQAVTVGRGELIRASELEPLRQAFNSATPLEKAVLARQMRWVLRNQRGVKPDATKLLRKLVAEADALPNEVRAKARRVGEVLEWAADNTDSFYEGDQSKLHEMCEALPEDERAIVESFAAEFIRQRAPEWAQSAPRT